MTSSRARLKILRYVLPIAMIAAAISPVRAGAENGAGTLRDATLAQYIDHLGSLEKLVADCQKLRTGQACDASKVSSDDRVQLEANGISLQREIRYDWLRDLLEKAGEPEQPAAAENGPGPGAVVKTPELSLNAKLDLAQERLEADAKEAESFTLSNSNYDAEHKALATILARKEYQGVTETSARERFLEWLGNAIDAILDRLASFGRRSPWIGSLIRALLFVGIAVALVWVLIRIERRVRTRLIPETQGAVGRPSAREWQLWRADALAMAGQGRWREAIHFLYWAAISRLESRHVWSADRARTPREYLKLVSGDDARKASLTTLTRSFERTWYGGREASSNDFQTAMKLAAELGVE